MNSVLQDALTELEQHGLRGEVEQGPHLKVRFVNQFGRKCLLVVSRSPSSRFALQQSRSELRRLLRRQP
ncbi:MAG: hypothetical protein ACLP19_27165 [Xanthobacteraceae bacterium]